MNCFVPCIFLDKRLERVPQDDMPFFLRNEGKDESDRDEEAI